MILTKHNNNNTETFVTFTFSLAAFSLAALRAAARAANDGFGWETVEVAVSAFSADAAGAAATGATGAAAMTAWPTADSTDGGSIPPVVVVEEAVAVSGLVTCGPFHRDFASVTYGLSKISWTLHCRQ